MSAGESLMTSNQTEDAKTELGIDAQFTREGDQIAVTTAPIVVGLTKEELERYRNDPKFRVLRWALFILFWLTWLGLFVGAIALIVFSPRQDVNPDKRWYLVTNTYEIFVPAFVDSDANDLGDFNGVQEKLDYLQDLKVDSILLNSVFEMDKDSFGPAEVMNFGEVDKRFGGKEEFKTLVKTAYDSYQIRTIVDVPLNVSFRSKYLDYTYKTGGRPTFNLDLSRNDTQHLLFQAINYVKTLGAHGVYIHGYDLSKAPVEVLNKFINASRVQVNDKDFAIFVGCVSSRACSDIEADVVLIDASYNHGASAADKIESHLEHANWTIKGNTSFAVLGNSAYHPRIAYISADAKERYNFFSLLNTLRLFIYPVAHSFYGDEYGYENSAALTPQIGILPEWDFSSSERPRFFQPLKPDYDPLYSAKSKDAFIGLGNLRHKLRHANTTFISETTIIRLSHDDVYYALFYNKAATPKTLPYKSLVPENLVGHLVNAQTVYQDGTDGMKTFDLTDTDITLQPFGHEIWKLSEA